MKFFDGAFGTYYLAKTGDLNPCELANIANENAVCAIHKEYIKAGAGAIKTNTFGANPSAYGTDKLREIIAKGYDLAVRAANGTDAEVFADIGNIDANEAEAQYAEVAEIFIKLGAANFLFETLSEFNAVKPALRLIKSRVENATVLVSFAVSRDGFTGKGLHYKTLINEALQCADVDIAGLNCVCGPVHMLNLAKALGTVSKPLSLMPNAGYPSVINGRTVFQDNAEYFSQKLAEMSFADVLGGCCGTTPKHIELAIKTMRQKSRPASASATKRANTPGNTKRLPPKELLVELDPPADCGIESVLSSAARLKECGVAAVTLADSPLAKARADSILTAAKIKSEIGIDVLPHMTCRDKNHIAIKASLLGASFFGINKILAVTGDPAYNTGGKKPGVFDFNSIELIAYINSLNGGVFAANPFSIGGALNVNAPNFGAELARCRRKLENGADFLLSQPIFTERAAENFRKARELNCRLYAGILPVAGYKNAVFLNNEVPGIEIPSDILERLKDKGADEADAISAAYACDTINDVYDYADGFYIMTPLKRVSLVCRLIRRCFDV